MWNETKQRYNPSFAGYFQLATLLYVLHGTLIFTWKVSSLQHVSVISAFKHQYQKQMFEGQKSTSPPEAFIYTTYTNTCKKIGLCSSTAPWGFLWSASFDAISISFRRSLSFFPSVSLLQLADSHLCWDHMEFHYESYLVNHVVMPNIHFYKKKKVSRLRKIWRIFFSSTYGRLDGMSLRTRPWWR